MYRNSTQLYKRKFVYELKIKKEGFSAIFDKNFTNVHDCTHKCTYRSAYK